MAEFLGTQLDYIFFFYGLAFILLGAVCFTIKNHDPAGLPWTLLAAFGIAHGVNEWLDLLALSIGDAPAFALLRLAVMAASYVLLLEFARLGVIRLGGKAPGRWIYGPLVLSIALGGVIGGLNSANAVARYALGLPGGMGAGLAFAVLSRRLAGSERRWAVSVGAALALYGIAAGAIVPPAPFWPAAVLNHDAFFRATGIPIQLLRGLLACWMAFSLWAFGQQKILLAMVSSVYAGKLYNRSVLTFVPVLVGLLGLGWGLAEYLGRTAQQQMQHDAMDSLSLLASRLRIETTTADDVARSMAESPWVLPVLTGGGEHARDEANMVADLSNGAAGGDGIAYLMDGSGTVLASSNRWKSDSLMGKNYSFRPYFQQAIAGGAAYYYALGVTTGERGYYASHPVRDKAGRIAGVAVIKKPLDPIEADLGRVEHSFLIAPQGVVFLASDSDMLFKTLWPLPAETQLTLTRSRQFGDLRYAPLLEQEIVDGSWIVFKGERHYAGRHYTGHDGWSFVVLKTPRAVAARRLFGITITLLFAVLTVIYLMGMERLLHDKIALEQQLELKERARKLDLQATTDPLTGVFNRLKFNQELAAEMDRSARYKTPLALVMYDIDHFKAVNDTHGHHAGDQVLTGMCRIVAGHIRQTDVLTRWGGEEFMILAPNCDGRQAFELAEKLRRLIEQFVFAKVGTVTCSFGVTQFQDGDTAETLTSRADTAMYAAKRNGRNRVVRYEPAPGQPS
ncbi:MAG: sensor domain-containing diguanylate cyclase [Sulfuricella sp.]|nr:diguanylate cyclase [Gammaproteobacteria bacterium]